jgi:ABC-type Fe3+-hydroxamate transport system substrate-binding protein
VLLTGGTAVLTASPARAVTLSDTQELGSLLALGVVPTATGYTPYEGDTLVPWAAQAGAGDIERFLVPNVQVPVERVACPVPAGRDRPGCASQDVSRPAGRFRPVG